MRRQERGEWRKEGDEEEEQNRGSMRKDKGGVRMDRRRGKRGGKTREVGGPKSSKN